MSNLIKPPIWYWIVSVFYLLWNGMGVNQYLQQAYNTETYRSQYTAEQLEAAANMPSWIMGAFAIAVFFAFLGSILLLLRKKFAYIMALVALIAVIAQMSYLFFATQPTSLILPITVLVLSVLFMWFSKHAMKKQWIG
ncbi:hypothetical protein [Formosa sp. S-31]|uniref:hypothetical protein n=1 Tax=Formosa sp. S-31 TaxID=2790949 RepID=UPI003EBDD53D